MAAQAKFREQMQKMVEDQKQQHRQRADIRGMCCIVGGEPPYGRPVNPATIHRMVKDGRLPPPHRTGRISRWWVDEVYERLADAREINSS